MKSFSESRSTTLWLVCLAGFAFVALNALRSVPQIADLFITGDGDDKMRLVEIRDWLGGQGWFDMRQYRILPPEGISMHWSRYLDAAIAAVLIAAGWVLPALQAEHAALILWPSLLACMMVLVLTHAASRLFSPIAAIGALAVFFSWGKLGGEFAPGRIDHHNVQILCATALFYLSLVPGRAMVLGALGGAITAFGLCIGIEMLPIYATLWGMMALRFAVGEDQADRWLLGFCATITVAAPLLVSGQLPMADWGRGYCDVLALPVLTLGAVGVAATVVPVLCARWLRTALARVAAQIAIAALGLWLAYPLLGQCLAGPYAQVPEEVRLIIESNIIEARSASLLLHLDPTFLAGILLPPLVLVAFGLLAAWNLWPQLGAIQRLAVIQAGLVSVVGFGFALMQIRAANLMTPAIPVFGALLVYRFALIPRQSLMRIPAVGLLLLALPATVQHGVSLLDSHADHGPAGTVPGRSGSTKDCQTTSAMAELASLPKSTIFSSINLGPTILAFTDQSATSAAYHRSPDAFWNGFGAFTSADLLKRALITSRADYLVLCNGGTVESGSQAALELQAGHLPAWLTDVSDGRKEFQVLKVDKLGILAGAPAP